MDGKFVLPHMPLFVLYTYVYMCVCRTFITRRVHGRFSGLDLEKEIVVLDDKSWRSLDQLMMKKTTADSKSKGMNTGYTGDLHGQ